MESIALKDKQIFAHSSHCPKLFQWTSHRALGKVMNGNGDGNQKQFFNISDCWQTGTRTSLPLIERIGFRKMEKSGLRVVSPNSAGEDIQPLSKIFIWTVIFHWSTRFSMSLERLGHPSTCKMSEEINHPIGPRLERRTPRYSANLGKGRDWYRNFLEDPCPSSEERLPFRWPGLRGVKH